MCETSCLALLSERLQQRVALLTYCEQQHYPAPQVVHDTTGSGVHRSGEWSLLVTTYMEGQANVLTEESTSQLGSALGQLHRLQPSFSQVPGVSWWNPATLIHALKQLQRVAALIPLSSQQLYEDICCSVQAIQQQLALLPEGIIHGDCWPPNGVQNKQGQMVLIDWEYAGRGAAILDLGAFLLTCQCDQYGGFPPALDEKRISAAVRGYTRWRALTTVEQAALSEAICFSVCWRGGWLFSRLLQEAWTPQWERSMQRTEHAFILAKQTAHYAQACFEHS